MAGSTITGAVAGMQVAVNASTTAQQGVAAQVLNSAAASNAVVFKTASGMLTGNAVIVSGTNSLVTGATSVPSAMVLLNGQADTYINNGTTLSTVVAADNTNSTIINSNPRGALIGVTGAGANVLAGFVKVNQFISGVGGQDAVFLMGTRNSLVSNGTDAVMVGGPSTVTAAASGLDAIVMTPGTALAFVNGSAASVTDSITGAANGVVVVAGMGNTSVTAGAGAESFFVDTSSGNVTLNAGLHPSDVLVFVQDGPAGTNQTDVANLGQGDAVLLHGYASYSIAALVGNAAGSVLSLSDGSKVTFNDASAATVAAAVRAV